MAHEYQDLQRELDGYTALVLNADYRPLSYYPLSTWGWVDTIKAVCRGTVTVLSEYDREIRSPSMSIKLPSVIVLNDFVKPAKTPAFSRFNVFLRDGWRCQYCNKKYKTNDLTFDHVIPRCKGGLTTWENIVTACRKCNLNKGSRSVKESGFPLLSKPHQPDFFSLNDKGRKFPPTFLHESWQDYLYWDSELQG